MNDSENLRRWLDELYEDEADDLGLDDRRMVWYFPDDQVREEYLKSAQDRSDAEVQMVLQHLLLPSCSLAKDDLLYELYLDLRDSRKRKDKAHLARLSEDIHFQRVVRYHEHANADLPWQGIQWVQRLLPHRPHTALQALETYLLAHMWNLTDNMVHAIQDAEMVIQARYIGVPESSESRRRLLLSLSPQALECMVAHLYKEMGYEVEVTPRSHDGGRDVVARFSAVGRKEHLLIECKRMSSRVGVRIVRALAGVISNERANRGVLVATSGFTRDATREADRNGRIELIGGSELVVLINEYLGASWPVRLEYLTRPPVKLMTVEG
ncbi:restriction endonuclease [Flindersiella endophytica]